LFVSSSFHPIRPVQFSSPSFPCLSVLVARLTPFLDRISRLRCTGA
jgi:hypothetical protein